MNDTGTIAALIGLGNRLADQCGKVIESLKNSSTRDHDNLNVIRSYCAILQAAITQICTWASTKLPKSFIPTSSVIAVQAATSDILEFVTHLHHEVDTISDTVVGEALHESRLSTSTESTLARSTQQLQVLAGGLQLMVAATIMPIEDTNAVILAISHASESISSSFKSIKASWEHELGVSGLSLEDRLLSSPVYKRVSRYELEANSIARDLSSGERRSPTENVRYTAPGFLQSSDSRQSEDPHLEHTPFLGAGLTTLDDFLNHSPNASVPPSIVTQSNHTIGHESHDQIPLLPTRQQRRAYDPPPGLIAVQADLIVADQPGLIAVNSKYDPNSGLISANQSKLFQTEQQNGHATPAQSLILSLDGDGFLGSYCHLLVLQNLFEKISRFESTVAWEQGSSLNLMATSYFDEIVGTGTGGLIAILLGRLRLPLGECITAFKEMGKKLLDPYNFDTTRGLSPLELAIQYRQMLKRVVRETLEMYSRTDPAGASFYKKDNESCRTVITSFDLSYSGSSTGAHTFYSCLKSREKERARELVRGYRNPEIWRVTLATLEHRISVQPSLLKDVPFIDESVQEKSPAVRLYRKIVSDNGNDPQSVKALICMGTRESSGRAPTSQPWNYSYEWLSKQNQPRGVMCYRFEMHRKFKAFSFDCGSRDVQNKLSSAETLATEYLSSEVVQNGLMMCAKLLVGSRQSRARQRNQ